MEEWDKHTFIKLLTVTVSYRKNILILSITIFSHNYYITII